MNLYSVQIDLVDSAKALSFAHAVEQWLGYLQSKGTIRSWRMLRRKLNLASDCYKDFLIEMEFDDLAQLDSAFRIVGSDDEEAARLHGIVHQMVGSASYGLYRSFPDAERAERMAII